MDFREAQAGINPEIEHVSFDFLEIFLQSGVILQCVLSMDTTMLSVPCSDKEKTMPTITLEVQDSLKAVPLVEAALHRQIAYII